MSKVYPRLWCHHGTLAPEGNPHLESEGVFVADSEEARTVAYWVNRLPPGVSFYVEWIEHADAPVREYAEVLRWRGGRRQAPPVAMQAPLRRVA